MMVDNQYWKKMNQLIKPSRISPPGRILERELDARGWTQEDFVKILGWPYRTISEIINGNQQIMSETAIELSEALCTSAELWANLESTYKLHSGK